jgi:hypothetical protein
MTFGGLFPLGDSGKALLPHPVSMTADAIQVAETRVRKTGMHTFAMALFIKLYLFPPGR